MQNYPRAHQLSSGACGDNFFPATPYLPGPWPQPTYDPALKEILPQLRKALDDGDFARAEALSRKLQVDHVAAYQPLIDLWVDDRSTAKAPQNYLRQLTFATGTVSTSRADQAPACTAGPVA